MGLPSKRIIVTGGNGFLGYYVCKALKQRGCTIYTLKGHTVTNPGVYIIPSRRFDLTQEPAVRDIYALVKPDIVIHLAAVVGGIGANQQHQGIFYYKNLMMGTLMLEFALDQSLEKFVAIGTVCSYPKHTPVPFKEEDLWNGYPEETNAPYGLAKKMMLVQAQAYRQEFGLNTIYLIPTNLYGPEDNFDLDTSHVIPALIKKCITSRNHSHDTIDIWGTGTATREFLFVEDAAEAIVLATEKYNYKEPLNIGCGQEISILDLATLIKKLTGFKGEFRFNSTKPDGQPRRCLNTSHATTYLEFCAKTSLTDGLRKTIEWYESQI